MPQTVSRIMCTSAKYITETNEAYMPAFLHAYNNPLKQTLINVMHTYALVLGLALTGIMLKCTSNVY